MKNFIIQESLDKLTRYITEEDYRGYDPYDTLNSWLPFGIIGKWGSVLATQFQKRNPINIRPLIGINKDINPKAMGLFLQAYSLLYKRTYDNDHLNSAKYFCDWLIDNYIKTNSGLGWGYNFPWASPEKLVKAYTPTAVVTGFIARSMYEYYKISNDESVPKIIFNAANFIKNDLANIKDKTGICISYTPLRRDICYNASLLAAEVLAINYILNGDEVSKELAVSAVNFVVQKQKNDGVWAYSQDLDSGKARMQIDFHQGYVIESIFNISNYLNITNKTWKKSTEIGLEFYRKNQFNSNGRSYWRIPKEYPVEIHNQAQGIITFSRLCNIYPDGLNFANAIADWTITNMQDKKGNFYYKKFKTYTNKIAYMRWSQAWMFLALVTLLENK